MNEQPLILVVEDDPSMREMIALALEGAYRVAGALGGEEAVRAAVTLRPRAILLDVEMPPGIDGYETCRRLKADEATAEIPVLFVSARDGIEDRLLGYEAGGEDYMVKPFEVQELEAKLAHLLRRGAERAGLKEMATYASSTAMTAMTSMSEMGALLQVMKSFSSCADDRMLAEAALTGLAPYGLSGAVQVRSTDGTLTRTAGGEASPLEASVISQMAGMERIVQFKSRMSIAYPRVSLLVHDMPVDSRRTHRLRRPCGLPSRSLPRDASCG
jgi:DNA-binding response OmpR family regulator